MIEVGSKLTNNVDFYFEIFTFNKPFKKSIYANRKKIRDQEIISLCNRIGGIWFGSKSNCSYRKRKKVGERNKLPGSAFVFGAHDSQWRCLHCRKRGAYRAF